jgi:hypothetical protein
MAPAPKKVDLESIKSSSACIESPEAQRRIEKYRKAFGKR